MENINVLNEMVLVDFIVGGSTGEKTTGGDDFMREVGKMLPKNTFGWASNYRTLAKREVLKVGAARRVNNRVRGYFVPSKFAAPLSDKLKAIKQQFLAEKADFLQRLPGIIEAWANEPANQVETHGGLLRAELIRKHAPSVSDIDRALTFDVSAVMLQQTQFFGEDDALKTELKGLVGQAALEISEDVKKSWNGPATGRTSSRVLGLIRRIRHKAYAMSVLSPKFENLQRMCDDVLKSAPSEGLIEGVAFLQVSALLGFCLEPHNILADQAIAFDPLDVTVPAEPDPVLDTLPLALELMESEPSSQTVETTTPEAAAPAAVEQPVSQEPTRELDTLEF